MRRARILRLAEGGSERITLLADRVALSTGNRITVTVTRTGKFHDPRYGDFEITRPMLASMVRNFDAGTYGQDIALDVAHQPQNGAAGYFRKLYLDGDKLKGEVELTPFGVDAIKNRGYRYLSAEYSEDFTDNEQRQSHGPTLLAAGLTVRPVIKHLDPVQLAGDVAGFLAARHKGPALVADNVIHLLSEDIAAMKILLAKLKKYLAEGLKLPDALVKALAESFEKVGGKIDGNAELTQLEEAFEAQGKTLAEAIEAAKTAGGGEIKLDMSGIEKLLQGDGAANKGGAKALTEDDVKRILAEASEAAAKKRADDAKALADNQAAYDAALDAAKALSDDTRKQLAEGRALVTGAMNAEQVAALAKQQIALGEKIEAAKKLSGLGYQVQGSTHVQTPADEGALKLQEQIDGNLAKSPFRGQMRLAKATDLHPFVQRVLAEFDRRNGRRLAEEAKFLAGSDGTLISDTALPASFQRAVIKEALSDLNILNVINAMTDPSAQGTTYVPYEERDESAIVNDAIVYEGQGINPGGISQKNDLAYIVPMKIALKVSNEVMWFTRNNRNIDWDAWARNVYMNARVMRELVAKRLANEIQRAADSYLAASIVNEDHAADLDGATSTFKTAQFPIVRPFQAYDLQGTAIGNPENPITVNNGANLAQYDGTRTQAAGTYWRVTSYNLGYIQLVNQLGVPVTPAAGGTLKISYDYATNVAKFSSDVPNGTDVDVYLNGLLRTFGARKAMLSADRYIVPDFAIMSHILNDTITNAKNFIASHKRNGTGLAAGGDLQDVKDVPCFSTNAPGIDLGDERVILGQRGLTSYVIAKPYQLGQPFEAVDNQGRPTGEKVAYGEEYSAIKTPLPIRGRYTSIIYYSAANR